MEWLVDIKGDRHGSWEISVIRKGNLHGFASYGWFDENKLLISHNGGPCHWPIEQFVWDKQIEIANEFCKIMNDKEKSPTQQSIKE